MKNIDRNDALGVEVSAEAKIMLDTNALLNTTYLDIPYATQHQAQKLDILLPNSCENPPLIVFIHGGGFLMGDKRNIHTRSALKMVFAGFAVASINYRLSTDAIWPAQIYDCKAAIRFLRANAYKYGYNSSKIAVWGNSAGGQLAAMIATTSAMKDVEDLSMGNENEPSNIDAAILWFADTDLRANPKYNKTENDPIVTKLLGRPNRADDEIVKQASPVLHIHKSMPPMLIQHGTNDTTVDCKISEDFYNQYVDICGSEHVYLDLLEGEPHSGDGFHTDKNLLKIVQFLDVELLNKLPRKSIALQNFPLIYP